MSEEDKPFIAMVTGKSGHQLDATRFPENCMLVIHESDIKETSLMVLTKIRMKNLDMRCGCGNPKCTLVIRWRAERSGNHPKLDEQG